MMKLSTMWNVHRLDEADGRNPLAEKLLERWTHDPGTARLFRASANSVFVFRRDGTRCFLRVADTVERERGAVEAEVDLVQWLAGAGIRVAMPLPSQNEQRVETVTTTWGTFHAVAFGGLDGAHLDIGALDAPAFRAWGAALGQLHAAMQAYTGPARAVRPTWMDQLAFAGRQRSSDAALVRQEIDRVASALRMLPVDAERYGLIHGDFELDNLCWRDDSASMLDFDDCARSWYVADIAFALRDLLGDFDDDINPGNEKLRSFVDGYAAHHPLDEDILAQLPTFRRLGNLVQYTRIARSLDCPEEPEHPEWLRALRRKLSGLMESYEASFRRRQH